MSEKSIIDLDDALNRALGDAAFLKMMFDEFQQMIPDFIAAMESAIQKGAMDDIDKTAHQLKGAAANLGALGVSAASLALERIGKSGDPKGAQEALDDLKQAVEIFNRHLLELDWAAIGE